MAVRMVPLLSCFVLLPAAAGIAFLVFLIFWLREKASRDDLVMSLLDGINTELEGIANTMKRTSSDRAGNRQ